MTTFTQTTPLTAVQTDLTATILDLNSGPHDFLFANKQVMTIENNEAVPLTLTFVGMGATSFFCDGIGNIDTSSGIPFTVAAGNTETIHFNDVRNYFNGGKTGSTVTLTVTGSTAPALAFGWLSTF